MKKWILAVACIGLCLMLMAFMPKATPIGLYVIGDSTASSYDGGSYPRMGWAQVLQSFFERDSVRVFNKALSGRSSKSYYHEGAGWPSVKATIQTGDFLFIQFGHNDSKPDTARFTDPFTTYQEYLTRYIDEARALGATPVLMTSIHRNSWSSDTLSVKDTHGDYLVAVRELAQEQNVALIDMAILTDSLYEALGYTHTTEQVFLNLSSNLYPAYLNGNDDNTHLQENGAYELAKLVADALAQQTNSQVAPLQPGLLDMVKVPLGITPTGSGYVQGPRYFPVEVEKSLLAKAAPGYEFKAWALDGQTVSEIPFYPFVLLAGDTAQREAQFGLPSSLPGDLPGLKVSRVRDGHGLVLQSSSPIKTLRLIDSAGRSHYNWHGEPLQKVNIDLSALPAGAYFLYIQRGKDEGWKKVLRN
jgi:lysophospholipase L1-like esterase